MTPSTTSALQLLIDAADARYGAFASTHEAMGVALEEWDELRDAIRDNDLSAVAKESLDLAAACIRLHDQLAYVQMLRDRSVK